MKLKIVFLLSSVIIYKGVGGFGKSFLRTTGSRMRFHLKTRHSRKVRIRLSLFILLLAHGNQEYFHFNEKSPLYLTTHYEQQIHMELPPLPEIKDQVMKRPNAPFFTSLIYGTGMVITSRGFCKKLWLSSTFPKSNSLIQN